MASELSRVLKGIESMTREYYSNPSPALKHRIDKALERRDRLQAAKPKKKKKKKSSKLKIPTSTAT